MSLFSKYSFSQKCIVFSIGILLNDHITSIKITFSILFIFFLNIGIDLFNETKEDMLNNYGI